MKSEKDNILEENREYLIFVQEKMMRSLKSNIGNK
jgi:hypothetical protein